MPNPTLTLDDIPNIHLDKGAHDSPDDGMCVMEATALLAGEGMTDTPACASPVIATFLRSWNDVLPDDDRQQLKRYIPLLIGTAGSSELEERRTWMCTDWLVRTYTPAWLRLAGLTDQADTLAGLPEFANGMDVPSIRPTIEAVRSAARAAAWDAAGAAAWDAAGAAAGAAAGDAAGDAAGAAAGAAARAAAGAAARAAAWDAARAAAWDAAGDAARDAARAAAGDAAGAAAWAAAGAAARAAAGAAARDAARDAAWAAAGAAARDAAGAALEPTKVELQEAAHALVARMIEAR